MKIIYKLFPIYTLVLAAISSCSPAPVTYIKNIDNISAEQLKNSAMVYEAKIMPKDILTIAVNTTVPEAAAPFNLGSSAGSGIATASGVAGAELQTYIVDNNGYIEYPVVGSLFVKGLTRVQLQELIKSKIHPAYITEVPIVNVRFKNYKISVLGEVSRPGTFIQQNEQCTIFDALALAGDLTIYGRRDNVLLVRENEDGTKLMKRINLQDANLLLDPEVYYLQQNDVLYVEPNRTRAQAGNIGTGDTFTITIISTLITVASFIINIVK